MTPPHHLRIRGGVEYDRRLQRWRPIIHLWFEAAGRGAPDQRYEWIETYPTQAAAINSYASHVRPALDAMLAETTQTPGVTVDITRWGFKP
jgi:hypothetical protein